MEEPIVDETQEADALMPRSKAQLAAAAASAKGDEKTTTTTARKNKRKLADGDVPSEVDIKTEHPPPDAEPVSVPTFEQRASRWDQPAAEPVSVGTKWDYPSYIEKLMGI